MVSVVSLAFSCDPHISPMRINPPVDRPIKKALQTQLSPGLIGGEIYKKNFYAIIDDIAPIVPQDP